MPETIMLEKEFVFELLSAMTEMTEFIREKEDQSVIEKRFCLVFQLYQRDILNGLAEGSSISSFVVDDKLFDELFQQVTLLEKEIARNSDISATEKVFQQKVKEYIGKINTISPSNKSL